MYKGVCTAFPAGSSALSTVTAVRSVVTVFLHQTPPFSCISGFSGQNLLAAGELETTSVYATVKGLGSFLLVTPLQLTQYPG